MDNLKSGFERRSENKLGERKAANSSASPELNRFRGKLFYFDDECQREINYKGTKSSSKVFLNHFRCRPMAEIHRRGCRSLPYKQDHALHFQIWSKARSREARSCPTTASAFQSFVAKGSHACCCTIKWISK